MKQDNTLKSKYFELKQLDFNEKEVKGALKDLERFKRIFEESLNIKIKVQEKEKKEIKYYCSKCKRKLKELETNPNDLCDKCWGKIVDKTDMSIFDEI